MIFGGKLGSQEYFLKYHPHIFVKEGNKIFIIIIVAKETEAMGLFKY